METGSKVRFADFEADLTTGELERFGKRVPVQRKPFQILELLLRSSGELVTREEIYESVWPDVHVDQQRCLNVAIRKLRAALAGSAPGRKLVETIGSRGYRLAAPVARPLENGEPAGPPGSNSGCNSLSEPRRGRRRSWLRDDGGIDSATGTLV